MSKLSVRKSGLHCLSIFAFIIILVTVFQTVFVARFEVLRQIVFDQHTTNETKEELSSISWCHWVQNNPEYPAERISTELKMRLNFLELIKAANIEYVLKYGTLLGSIRHNGMIPGDQDMDIEIYPLINKDERFKNIKSRHHFSILFGGILWQLIQNKSLDFNDIIIVKNPYPCGPIAAPNGDNQLLFNDSKYFNPKYMKRHTYIFSLTVGSNVPINTTTTCGYLRYPVVLDIIYYGDNYKMMRKSLKYGKICKCKFHYTVQHCREFSHLDVLGGYGKTYMIPLKNSGTNNNRKYGNSNDHASIKSKLIIQKEKTLWQKLYGWYPM